MGGGTGTGGQDPRWIRIQALKAEISSLKVQIRDHAPTPRDYGRGRRDRRPGPPPPPPPETDPGIQIHEGGLRPSKPQVIEKGMIIGRCWRPGCWKALFWPWHRCKKES